MTFSGLPSVRDPKQSPKHSTSSASSSSSTASSPPKSPTSEQQQKERQHGSTDTFGPNTRSVPVSVTGKSIEGVTGTNVVDAIRQDTLELKQQPPTATLKTSTKTAAAKKKGVPQNLSPAQSAAYRKRLNVNQGNHDQKDPGTLR